MYLVFFSFFVKRKIKKKYIIIKTTYFEQRINSFNPLITTGQHPTWTSYGHPKNS